MHGIAGTHGGRDVLILDDHLHRCRGHEDPCGLTWRHAKVGHVIACLKLITFHSWESVKGCTAGGGHL
jgi:hypothetical protein